MFTNKAKASKPTPPDFCSNLIVQNESPHTKSDNGDYFKILAKLPPIYKRIDTDEPVDRTLLLADCRITRPLDSGATPRQWAHLFAAAPDLLRELKRAHMLLERCRLDGSVHAQPSVLDEIQFAINKALE